MAIGAGAAIEFFGTQNALGTSSAAVASNAFSIASDLSTWVNVDDALTAKVVLFANFIGTAPAANRSINLYLRLLNIQGTNDQDVPSDNYEHIPVGSFPVNNVLTPQNIPLQIDLTNHSSSQSYEFYIRNGTDQSLPSGWNLYVKSAAVGSSA